MRLNIGQDFFFVKSLFAFPTTHGDGGTVIIFPMTRHMFGIRDEHTFSACVCCLQRICERMFDQPFAFYFTHIYRVRVGI